VALKFDEHGLIPAVVQDRLTGQVRMVGWMNREALSHTLSSGCCTFFSRTRQELWEKGETSGHRLHVERVIADCDEDTLLVLADPVGPSCHTGRPSCFFRATRADGSTLELEVEPEPFLWQLASVIRARRATSAAKSYTRSLLDAGPARVADKIREEADELGRALVEESAERVASEAADLVYHLLVGLELRSMGLRSVIEALAARSNQSGLEEKAARASFAAAEPSENEPPDK
jgi:phosphoribosyl-AMP cyclohydrolase / phosphoribosyl-ATP pyrophosphohydrolase